MKLTKAQERAKTKLTDHWLTPYDLQESITTLYALVRRGEARMNDEMFGSMFSPRTCWGFKLATKEEK